MNKTIKNIILVFTLLCAIVLVVFCVELFMLNRESGSDMGSQSAAANDEPGNTPNGGDNQSNGADEPANGNDNGESQPSGQPEIPVQNGDQTTPSPGERSSFWLSPEAELVFYLDRELFEDIADGAGRFFPYLGDGEALFEIGFVYLQSQNINSFSASYLDKYLDGEASVVHGMRSVGNSLVYGIYAIGASNGVTYEAWVCSLTEVGEDGMVLIIFVYYENEEQKAALYNILSSMEIAPIGEGVVDSE